MESSGSTVDRPVFVDASGRRRTVRRIAVTLTAAMVAAVGILIAMLLGAPVVPTALLPAPQVNPTAAGVPPDVPATPVARPPVTTPPTRRTTPARTTVPVVRPSAAAALRTVPVTTTQPAKPGHGKSDPPGHGR